MSLLRSLPTVAVCDPSRPDHPLVINQSDYDPTRHTLWEDRGAGRAPVAAEAGPGPSPSRRQRQRGNRQPDATEANHADGRLQ